MYAQKQLLVYNKIGEIIRLAATQARPVIATDKKFQYYKKQNENVQNMNMPPAGWEKARPFNELPGPTPLPIIGNLWRFLIPKYGDFYGKDFVRICQELNDRYGDTWILKGIPGQTQMVHIFDPTDIENMFRNEGTWPIRMGGGDSFTCYQEQNQSEFKGVVSVDGEQWFKHRSTVNPILMKPQNVLQYTERMSIVAGELVKSIQNLASQNDKGEMPEDFTKLLSKWALQSVCLVTLDKDLDCLNLNMQKDSPINQMINEALEVFELMFKLDVRPGIWKTISTPTWRRFTTILNSINGINRKYIDEAVAKFTASKSENEETSILEKMVQKDEKIAIGMAMEMMIAGIDTTGRILSAALYYLARNPEKQRKLREEAITLLPEKDSQLTRTSIQNAEYVKSVVKETTRLAPIGLGNLRTIPKDLVLGGFQIPKGTKVVSHHLLLSTSEKHYPKAKEFIPERWLRSTTGKLSHKNTHPFVYQPFGFGSRSCVGKRIANLELEVALLKIIRNFELSWPHKDMTFKSSLFYGIADPLKLHVKSLQL